MRYDFDTVIDRRGTYAMKWELEKLAKMFGMGGNFTADTIPMMTADMDLQSPQPVIDAMHRVADHKMYGYSMHVADEKYFTSLCRWFKDRHDWDVQPNQIINSHGTFGALTHVAHMYAKPGEGIIVMDPVYGHFSQDIVKWGNEAVRCHLINDNGYYTINWELLEQLRPAMLKLLLMPTRQMALALLTQAFRKGVYLMPLRSISQWTSSEMTKTPYFSQISETLRISSGVQTRPTGLWGLQKISRVLLGSEACFSNSSQSMV